MPGIVWYEDAIHATDAKAETVGNKPRQSKVVRNDAEYVYVAQEFSGRYLFFKKNFTLLLKVHEFPPAEVHFEDVLMRSFDVYRGSWALHEEANGRMRVRYQLRFRSNIKVPKSIEKQLSLKNVEKLLEQLRTQIQQRNSEVIPATNRQPNGQTRISANVQASD